MEELIYLDATAQAELVRTGQAKPEELVQAAIQRCERLNPELNAVVTPRYEAAMTEAAGPLPDGPFSGVPFLLKDLWMAHAGMPMSCGSRFTADWRPGYENELARRYRRAGLVTLGMTNVPEMGLLPTTEPLRFGPTRNPWDVSRIAGGSSGGAAAAVAAGLVPVAHASDGGGSIRIPASCCGLFGLKPTRGRVSPAPGIYDPAGMSISHALTRSVRDSAALLDATAGPFPGDAYWAAPAERPFLAEVGADPGQLRIAYSLTTINGAPVAPDCTAAVMDSVSLLTDLGHIVEEAEPNLAEAGFTQTFTGLWAAACASSLDALAALIGRPLQADQFEPFTWSLAALGRHIPAPDFIAALAQIQTISRQVAAFMARYDVWLMPTLAQPPLPLGTLDGNSTDVHAVLDKAAAFMPHAPLANATGQPAMSVPLHWTDSGLPVGVQFYGRYGDEATLFRLAAQLEEARPWADRRPPLG